MNIKKKILPTRAQFLKGVLAAVICTASSSCSYFLSERGAGGLPASLSYVSKDEANPVVSWQQNGLIVLSRPAPAITQRDDITSLGFVPLESLERGTWLKINRLGQSVAVMQGIKELTQLPAAGFSSLEPGTYEVKLKQENPLWYAPDSYFKSRNQLVPTAGDRSRYRRGALGDRAIFLSASLALHNAVFGSPEVGGLQLSPSDMEILYGLIGPGTLVEIK
jgi:hypothetical protein